MQTPLSKPQIWLLAARPKTLPAAAASVIVGSAAAAYSGAFRPLLALACLATALLLQIGANLANDLFDFYRGADTKARLGPTRVTQSGLLTPAEVRGGMVVVFGLAALIGLYILTQAGWVALAIGLTSILAALAYVGGPFPYGYYGLGDVMVFIFFGLAAVGGTYYVQAGRLHSLALLASIPMGLLIVAILVVNNLRDIHTDQAAGKHTLAVRLGVRGTRLEFSLCVGLAFVSTLLIAWQIANLWALLPWLAGFLAMPLVRRVWITEGRALNQSLAQMGQLTLWFGILLSLGLLLARFI